MARQRDSGFPSTEAIVAFASTLPFFAGFAMPDVFAGYAAVSTLLILVYWERLRIYERVALVALLAFCMVVHTSHLLDTIAIAIVAVVGFVIFKAPRQRASAALFTVIGAILVALLFRTLDSFRIFDNIYILTLGANGTGSVSILGYDNLFNALNLGIGSAISILIFICVAIIAFLFIKGFGTAAPGTDIGKR